MESRLHHLRHFFPLRFYAWITLSDGLNIQPHLSSPDRLLGWKNLETSPIPCFLCWSRISFALTVSTRSFCNFFLTISPRESRVCPGALGSLAVGCVPGISFQSMLPWFGCYLHFLSLAELEIMFFTIFKSFKSKNWMQKGRTQMWAFKIVILTQPWVDQWHK